MRFKGIGEGCLPSGRRVAILCLAVGAAVPLRAEVVSLDFEDLSSGEVLAGTLPGGGTASSDHFTFVTFSVENYGGGPSSLIAFDSSNPTGGDWDLGTPHQSFGGPGLGAGGAAGQPGENAVALGNVLIIAENLTDVGPADGVVDNPDDEGGGGKITATFAFGVTMDRITLVDMDDASRGSWIQLYTDESMVYRYDVFNLGNNSVQVAEFGGYENITRVEICFRGSGAVDDFEFQTTSTGTEPVTWGGLKSKYR